MKHFVIASILSVTIVLNGCGGGNKTSNNSSSGNSSTPGQAQGVFKGTASTGADFYSIILPNDKFYAIYGSIVGNVLYIDGMMTGQGASNNGKYSGSVTDFYSNGVSYAGSVSATYVAATSISGTVTENNANVTFSANAFPTSDFNYGTSATLTNVVGTWTGFLLDGSTAVVNINSNGSFVGSNAGCSFSGTVTPDSSGKNFFDVSITYGASPCVFANQTQSGIAVDYLLSDGVTHQLVAGVASGTSSGNVFIANR